MPSASVIFEDVLVDLLTFGEIAVGIYVKNPASQLAAQRIIQVVNTAIPVVQGQIAAANTPATTTASAAPSSGSVSEAAGNGIQAVPTMQSLSSAG